MRSGSEPRKGRESWTTSWTWPGSSGQTWRRYWARSETPKILWKTWRTPVLTPHSSNNRLRLLRYGGRGGVSDQQLAKERKRRANELISGRNAEFVVFYSKQLKSLYPSTRLSRQRRMVWGRSWSLSGPSELTSSLPVEKLRNLKSRKQLMRWEINSMFL